jgi:hypothetical protein
MTLEPTQTGEDGKVEVELCLRTDVLERSEAYCVAHNTTFDELVEKAMDGFIAAAERDKHVIKLLELQSKYTRKVEQLEDVGIDLSNGFEVIDFNLLQLALDMLGVPEDNSLEWDETAGGPMPEWLFCRDGFTNLFFKVVTEGTFQQCFDYVQRIRKWVEENQQAKQ